MACSLHPERRDSRMAIACVAAMLAASAIAAPWTLDGPADGGHASSFGAIATHPVGRRSGDDRRGIRPGDRAVGHLLHGGRRRPLGVQRAAWRKRSAVPRRFADGRLPRRQRSHPPKRRPGPFVGVPDAPLRDLPADSAARPGAVACRESRRWQRTRRVRRQSGRAFASTADRPGRRTPAPSGIAALVVDWSTRTIFATLASGATSVIARSTRPAHGSRQATMPWCSPRVTAWPCTRVRPAGCTARPTAVSRSSRSCKRPAPVALCDLAFAAAPSSRVYGLECASRRILRSDERRGGVQRRRRAAARRCRGVDRRRRRQSGEGLCRDVARGARERQRRRELRPAPAIHRRTGPRPGARPRPEGLEPSMADRPAGGADPGVLALSRWRLDLGREPVEGGAWWAPAATGWVSCSARSPTGKAAMPTSA